MIHPRHLPNNFKAFFLAFALTVSGVPSVAAQSTLSQNFRELLDRSEKERKSLVFYVKGQTITGIVVKVSADMLEVRNRSYNRILIRLDSIDAIAHN